MTDIHGNLLWYGEYTAWGRLKKDERVYKNARQPFRLQNQYSDRETGLHYNLMRYYKPETGRFISQDHIGLWGEDNFYFFTPNTSKWLDVLGLNKNLPVPYWPPGSNQKPYTVYRVLKPIDNVAASKIMPWFGEIGLGT